MERLNKHSTGEVSRSPRVRREPNRNDQEVAALYKDEIRDKVVLVTGCSPNSVGLETARCPAQQDPRLLIVSGRMQAKADAAVDTLRKGSPTARLRGLVLELDTLQQAREGAERVLAYDEDIDVLINMAGVSAGAYAKTKDGFEQQFGVNHLAPFLFTELLLPKILRTQRPRIINVASLGHRLSPIRWDDINFGKRPEEYNPWAG
jgi:NAD(P)-dependent dehydrogenase (short-subunit alcohol dehydrogenase family)